MRKKSLLLVLRNKVFSFLLVAVIVLLIFFLAINFRENEPLTTINIAIYNGEYSFPILLADRLGYFQNEGLDLMIRKYDSGVKAVEALRDDQVELATAAEFVAVNFIEKNLNLQILSTITFSDTIHLLIKDDFVQNGTINLSGSKIGLKKKSQAEYFIDRFILMNKVNLVDTEFIDIDPENMKAALQNNTLDGVVIWHPYAVEFSKVFKNDMKDINVQEDFDFYFLVMAKAETLSTESCVAFFKALKKVEEYINSNPEMAKGYMQELFKYSEDYTNLVFDENNFSIALPQSLLFALESERRWLQEKADQNPTTINYLNYINKECLKRVDPNSVTIF